MIVKTVLIFLLTLCPACASWAQSQTPSRGDRRGERRFEGGGGENGGPGGWNRGERRHGDRGGADRAARIEGFLRSMDANGDGVLQESEVPEERRGMLRMMAARMGQDAAKGIAIGTISQAIGGGGPPGRSEGTQNNNTPPNAPAAKEEPLVPGFGSEAQPQPVPSFGVRVETDQRVTLGTSLQEATKNIDPRMREEVRSLLSRYDRNHNRILEREEWAGMPGSPGDKDRDKDGKITMDELSSQASRGGPGGWPPGPFGVMPGQFGGMPSPFGNFSRRNETPENDDKKKDADAKKEDRPASYRFRTPRERLPQGLPSWFAQRDADADGQVAMSEFASDWTDSTFAEYASYDANNDGMITPEECLSHGDSSGGGGRDKAENGRPPQSRGKSSSDSKPTENAAKPWWMQP